MYCTKCGTKNKDGARFCEHCGASLLNEQPVNAIQYSPDIKENVEKRKGYVAILAGIGVAILILVVAIVFMLVKFQKKTVQSTDMSQEQTNTSDQDNVSDQSDFNQEELTPLYELNSVDTIDIYAQNHTPGDKTDAIVFESTYTYWMEDLEETINRDGYWEKCLISKKLLRNAETGELIQYEIYRDPDNQQIFKIVSIEPKDGQLELIDYYYDDTGKPNYIFKRSDRIYTPTYATQDKVGEQYFFNDDVMVKWYSVREPDVTGECELRLVEGRISYNRNGYFTDMDDIVVLYDDVEIRMLNAAYNTYNAMSSQAIGIMEGKVTDTVGSPLAGLLVDVFRTSDDVFLYRGITDEEGNFQIYTYMDNTDCYIVIRGNGGYKESCIYGVTLSDNGTIHSCNHILLHKVGGDEYPVHMNVYDAAQVRSNEDGSIIRNAVQGVTVSIRSGADAYTGDVIATAVGDTGGNISINLQSGVYTVQIEAPGYSVSYKVIEVSDQETAVESYMLPVVASGQTGIVLTWDDSNIDLDLTLFTPRQSIAGNMAHIDAISRADDYGNYLVADNSSGCEVMYLNTAEAGSYKLYVNSYTDIMSGNYSSNNLSGLNIHIYIYDSNGFITEYTFPIDQTGVVWEVVEINGTQIVPENRVYNSVEGKSWWTTPKGIALEGNLVAALGENGHLISLLTSMVHWYISDTYEKSEESVKDDINRLCQGDSDSILRFWGLNGDLPPHMPPVKLYDFPIDQYYWCYALEKDQMEYAAYSLTGKNISFASLDANVYGDGTCIGFGGLAGDLTWNELHNITEEYAGNNIWRVSADVWFGAEYDGIDAEEYQVADVTFLVKENPESCYDGFSVLGVESVHFSK